MFVVSALARGDDLGEFRDELAAWLEHAGALSHRMYPDEDGSISIFLDYASESEAHRTAAQLKEAWPFWSASLDSEGRYVFVFRAALSDPRAAEPA